MSTEFAPKMRVRRKAWTAPGHIGTVVDVPEPGRLAVRWDDYPHVCDEAPEDLFPADAPKPAPEATPAAAEPPKATATLQKDRQTGRSWLAFAGRPAPEVITALKAAGWRWSGYRKEWHNNRRCPTFPACIQVEDGGECDYSAERADRLEEAAGKAAGEYHRERKKVDQIMSFIPFGQPILVGHHSERRHRKDLARVDSGMRKACEAGEKARDLAAMADSSRAHQARMKSAPVIARRLERLRAQMRSFERDAKSEYAEKWTPENWDWQKRRVAELGAVIAENEAALAAAGGLVADRVEVSVGDLVLMNGFEILVKKVNKKTIDGVIASGGARGMRLRSDKTKLRKVLATAAELAAKEAAKGTSDAG